jgi:dynactin 1
MSSGGGGPVRDSPMLLQQVESLQEALQIAHSENRRLLGNKMLRALQKMAPLKVPKKSVVMSEDDPDKADIVKLSKDTSSLLNELYKECSNVRVVDITKRKPGTVPLSSVNPLTQLTSRTTRLASLQRSVTELQVQVTTMLAAHRPGGQIRTDFSTFPTPAFAKVLHEKASSDSQCVGIVRIPTSPGEGGTIIPLHVGLQQLTQIHSHFL